MTFHMPIGALSVDAIHVLLLSTATMSELLSTAAVGAYVIHMLSTEDVCHSHVVYNCYLDVGHPGVPLRAIMLSSPTNISQ